MKYKSKLFLLFILIIFCTIGIILDINRIKTCINQEKTKNLADFYQNNEKSSWVRSWGGPTNEWAITMAIDSQDNIYVTGILWESHSICLLKYDSSGHLLWSRIWEENDYYWGSSIALDSSDNIYLAGKIYSDFFLIKFDPLGNLLWERFWGEEFSVQECPGIAIDSLDHICVVGRIKYSSSNSNVDIFLIKFNSTGGIISNQFWDFIERDKIDGICLDSSNDIYLIINSQLIKYNSTYHLKWSYNLNNFGDRLTITI
ncbi:MAG: SBBP repeat-containing protein, partial [Promethearchaeota archaeon]